MTTDTQTTTDREPFNPNTHLRMLKNNQQEQSYLDVKWRIAWFRDIYPHGTIDTEELAYDLDYEATAEVYKWNSETRRSEKTVKHGRGYARYRAVVSDGMGGRSTGTKSENAANFPDFGEKAETGAIGRALAGLGFGTQFTGSEFDEGDRLADAPVDVQPAGNGSKPTTTTTKPTTYKPANTRVSDSRESASTRTGEPWGGQRGVSDKQRVMLTTGTDEREGFSVPMDVVNNLTAGWGGTASKLIDALMVLQKENKDYNKRPAHYIAQALQTAGLDEHGLPVESDADPD